MFSLHAILFGRIGDNGSPFSEGDHRPHWTRTLFHALCSLTMLTIGVMQVTRQRASFGSLGSRMVGIRPVFLFEGMDAVLFGGAVAALGCAYFSAAVLMNLPFTWRFAQPLWVLSLTAFCIFAVWFLVRFFGSGGIF